MLEGCGNCMYNNRVCALRCSLSWQLRSNKLRRGDRKLLLAAYKSTVLEGKANTRGTLKLLSGWGLACKVDSGQKSRRYVWEPIFPGRRLLWQMEGAAFASESPPLDKWTSR